MINFFNFFLHRSICHLMRFLKYFFRDAYVVPNGGSATLLATISSSIKVYRRYEIVFSILKLFYNNFSVLFRFSKMTSFATELRLNY